jgi:hypothetical protein
LRFVPPPVSMNPVSDLDLREAWSDLLARRSSFAESLAVYGELVERWATSAPSVTPLRRDAVDARALWERGVPLIAEAPPALSVDLVEEILGPTMELLASIRADEAPALQRFAEAWDRGTIGPTSLFPAQGRLGSLTPDIGLRPETLAFLGCVTLRPFLAVYFGAMRSELDDATWSLGVCPFCGAPPGFGDLVEDGRRRLACHYCGGGWIFSRLRCVCCGAESAQDLVRLEPGEKDEGYFISACKRCRGYVKELDRRVRWNGGPAIVEDWGSPHLDLVAAREGYGRPLPTLLQLARG